MTTQRRRVLAAPFLALALLTSGPGRNEVIALARAKFPAVMNRHEPARFLVMVFDSAGRYLWGFPVKGGIMIHVGSDTLTIAARMALQTGARSNAAATKADGARHSYVHGIPAFFRDSTRALRRLPTNTEDGLVPTSPMSDESGIDGLPAHSIVHIDRYALYPSDDQPLQFDIVAVHLLEARADTGRPPHSVIAAQPAPFPDNSIPPSGFRKASARTIVLLPAPFPQAVHGYELNACFDVAPNGDARLRSWTRSLDVDYNSKVLKSLGRYRFRPATRDGVAVRDTACIRARAQ